MKMKTTGKISGITANLVTVRVDGPVGQNEICYIAAGDGLRLMAEVIKVTGERVYIQVFDSTRGLKVGDPVEFEGHMLEVALGPGLLSRNYDGLQNDLAKMESLFIERGSRTEPLDMDSEWDFTPLAAAGDRVAAGDWLGEVDEQGFAHKIMVPFKFKGTYTVKSIQAAGRYRITGTMAVLTDAEGKDHEVTMIQRWPVKQAVTAYRDKPRPFRVMETGVRPIDTFNPIAEGGTGFIPGPFGAGKTVLQHAISKQAEADIIIMVACGERANEVVEVFTEFPELEDPRTGRKLMERMTIICNTSNMPVAAREASVYIGMAIGEYYRAMGLRVLILADSTSRWAQALREMSNRLEELPGQDAFPMDLSAIISNYYSRAGLVYLNNGQTGSVTFLGTVSPAGGNLKEPVTESTKKIARCFYALSQGRADSKRYPAIDPLDSYSKYLEYPEIGEYLDANVEPGWVERVMRGKTIVRRGKEAAEQINILGDDGVPIDYHDRFWKSELIDFVILQQDAFDAIDASTPMIRQKYMYNKVLDICGRTFNYTDFEDCQAFFKELINLFRQMNYSQFESEQFHDYKAKIDRAVEAKEEK
jgi:V/A-type H+-transporting ATPase subunit A